MQYAGVVAVKNRICEVLGIEKPVVQGPMVWLTDAGLAAAVSEAGGIADKRTFRAALALGAEGAYCGTAFLLSRESRMAENVKQAALKANAQDLLLFRTHARLLPLPARSFGL